MIKDLLSRYARAADFGTGGRCPLNRRGAILTKSTLAAITADNIEEYFRDFFDMCRGYMAPGSGVW